MPVELFADNASTTLTSSPAIAATSLTVASSTGFPVASNVAVPPTQFRVLIGTEMVTVTNVAGLTWTCNALVAAHTSADAVTQIVFAADLAAFQYPQNPLRPAGSDYETYPRNSNYIGAGAPANVAAIHMSIALPKGLSIGHIAFASSAAAVSPTHMWYGLYDQNLVQLATTVDNLTGAFNANTVISLAITKTASGVASSFVTTYAGLYYVSICQTATTPATLAAGIINSAVSTTPPILCGQAGANSTPPAFPFTAAALSVLTLTPYAYVGV